VELNVRRSPYTVPSYSLTSDLLSFLRCGLQYRYHGIGKLPATRPAQMWFGQFIHGVLEEAYRQYRAGRDATGDAAVPPVTDEQLDELCALLFARLAAQGLAPRNEELERIGEARARTVVRELGPLLFPVISQAEVRLTGTRAMRTDLIPARLRLRGVDRYEMAGVVDVITDIELADPALVANPLVEAIRGVLPRPYPGRFEVIIDYKGMRRPPKGKPAGGQDFWRIYEWQVQTYAQLRSVQADARPVAAAALLYLNELLPTWNDLALMREEIDAGTTDVAPAPGSEADRLIRPRRRGDPDVSPPLPFEFRLRRALRIVPVSTATQDRAAEAFDKVVARIEASRVEEQLAGVIIASWPKDTSDAATCAACDFRPICPDYQALPRRA
jgi:hypothetical protein